MGGRGKLSDIETWLRELSLEKYALAFSEAEIDFETLPELTEDDLKEVGLPVGPRRKVWGAIQLLRTTDSCAIGEAPTGADVAKDLAAKHSPKF